MVALLLTALVTLITLGLLLVLGCLVIAWLATCTTTRASRASCAWPCPRACSAAVPCWWDARPQGRDAATCEALSLWH